MNLCIKNVPVKKSETNFEKRPWGGFQQFTNNELSTVKIIKIDSYSKLSLQFHHNRDEKWIVLSGECHVTIGEDSFKAKKGDEFFIPREVKHRAETFSLSAEILEISSGEFDEEDIVRINDAYGRI